MSERIVTGVGTWEGVDPNVYSRIEIVENTNKNGVVSHRAYAIDGDSGKRKQVKNVYKNDPGAIDNGQNSLLAEYGHSTVERELYGLDEQQWARNTAMLQKWEEEGAKWSGGIDKLRSSKHYWQVLTDPEANVPAEIIDYERFIAQDTQRARHIDLENGFLYDPEKRFAPTASETALHGLKRVASGLRDLPTRAHIALTSKLSERAERAKVSQEAELVSPEIVNPGNGNFDRRKWLRRAAIVGGVAVGAYLAYKTGYNTARNDSVTFERYDELMQQNQSLSATNEALTLQASGNLDAINHGLDTVNNNLDAINHGQDAINQNLDGINDKLDSLGQQVSSGGGATPEVPTGGSSGGSAGSAREMFYVERGSGIINEIGQYANTKGVNLTDSQKWHIYQQLHGSFGADIIDIRYVDHDTYMVGSDVRLSSTGQARWDSMQVQNKLNSLINQYR